MLRRDGRDRQCLKTFDGLAAIMRSGCAFTLRRAGHEFESRIGQDGGQSAEPVRDPYEIAEVGDGDAVLYKLRFNSDLTRRADLEG